MTSKNGCTSFLRKNWSVTLNLGRIERYLLAALAMSGAQESYDIRELVHLLDHEASMFMIIYDFISDSDVLTDLNEL